MPVHICALCDITPTLSLNALALRDIAPTAPKHMCQESKITSKKLFPALCGPHIWVESPVAWMGWKSKIIFFKIKKCLSLSYALRYNHLEVLYPHQMGGSSFRTHLKICKFEKSQYKDSRAWARACSLPASPSIRPSIERSRGESCCRCNVTECTELAELTEMYTKL